VLHVVAGWSGRVCQCNQLVLLGYPLEGGRGLFNWHLAACGQTQHSFVCGPFACMYNCMYNFYSAAAAHHWQLPVPGHPMATGWAMQYQPVLLLLSTCAPWPTQRCSHFEFSENNHLLRQLWRKRVRVGGRAGGVTCSNAPALSQQHCLQPDIPV
jgi:hypothetical protein